MALSLSFSRFIFIFFFKKKLFIYATLTLMHPGVVPFFFFIICLRTAPLSDCCVTFTFYAFIPFSSLFFFLRRDAFLFSLILLHFTNAGEKQ